MDAQSIIGTKWRVSPSFEAIDDNTQPYLGVVVDVHEDDTDYLYVVNPQGARALIHKSQLNWIGTPGELVWGTQKLSAQYDFKDFAEMKISKSGFVRMWVSGKLVMFDIRTLTAVFIEREEGELPRLILEPTCGRWWFTLKPDQEIKGQLLLDVLLRLRDVHCGFIEE
jgi:hypothetical protein